MVKKMLKLFVCALVIGLTAGVTHADIESGLMGYWSFEEGTGDTTADISGNGNDGTLTNGPSWDDSYGALGGALNFDGSNDFVHCGELVPTEDGKLSLCVWIHPMGTVKAAIFAKRADWQSTSFDLALRNNVLELVRSGASGSNNWCDFGSAVVIPASEWTHIVVTVDGTDNADSAKAYINGEFIASGIWVYQCPAPNAPVLIGASQTDPIELFTGLIDEVRIYNRDLTETDALELYEFRSASNYNYYPEVEAGDSQSLLWPDNMIQLDATASDDGKPLTDPCDPCSPPIGLTLTWSQLSGPGTVIFSDTTIEDPTATFLATGTYLLELNAFDGEKSKSDTVGVSIRPDNDPIARWNFEEGTGGTTVGDSSAFDNVGTFVGEPNWASGWIGDWALECADNFYVKITVDPTADPNLDSAEYITVAAWVKIDSWLSSSSWNGIVTKGDGREGGVGGWSLIRNGSNDSLAFYTPGAGMASGSVNVKDGYWHHVAAVHNGTTTSLYVDGVLDSSSDASGLIAATTAEVWINGNSEQPDRFFDGMIDDVHIYSFGMTDVEVAALTAMGNLIPVVDAGSDETFYMRYESYQLAATVTDDGNPEPATLAWTQESGPGVAQFSDAAIEDPTVTFSEIGTYVLRLTADDTGAQIYDEVTITAADPVCQDVIDAGLLMAGDVSGPEGIPDCYVDLYDFAMFASYWLRCNDPQDTQCEFPYYE